MVCPLCIYIFIEKQKIILIENKKLIFEAPISTAKNGVGEQINSGCTPRGWHQIRAKIGEKCPINTVFKGRRPTGEIYTSALGQTYPNRDWILTRILWLSGLEPSKNRFGSVDTMKRYIYIHGTPEEIPIGIPNSHGCIRIYNEPLLKLFDYVQIGTPVFIAKKD
ncbi:ErfK/YbiS/YcfS/YnhG family protein [Candidatus Nitrosacidococcus tergens]|uniref:ErfK/YbiS/YcfS/YnhG family protein n=2 Tax=Candidatus Nitrosacidococcus tergens TaxID=553981 RepID=A0A7G1QA54_9GAMM|nr:ErfK/YbiS/YcfS/YnhG family protein [Candidatus Nitrosacidococcus tergens]